MMFQADSHIPITSFLYSFSHWLTSSSQLVYIFCLFIPRAYVLLAYLFCFQDRVSLSFPELTESHLSQLD